MTGREQKAYAATARSAKGHGVQTMAPPQAQPPAGAREARRPASRSPRPELEHNLQLLTS